jgi:hypothetical protein
VHLVRLAIFLLVSMQRGGVVVVMVTGDVSLHPSLVRHVQILVSILPLNVNVTLVTDSRLFRRGGLHVAVVQTALLHVEGVAVGDRQSGRAAQEVRRESAVRVEGGRVNDGNSGQDGSGQVRSQETLHVKQAFLADVS